MDPRIVLYAHDGSGFGHLQRTSRLAADLQRACTCMIITGTREAAWLVDPGCEFVKLPSWDSMYRRGPAEPDGKLWLDLPKDEVVRFRSQLIDGIVAAFDPDAVIVDHLPYGLRSELRDTLRRTRARKYLITRGVIDSADREVRELLPSVEVAALYDRILVASDRRVTDVLDDLPLSAEARAKCEWVGYMTPATEPSRPVRRTSGVPDDRTWVVCSAGSGLRGEALFSACLAAASEHPSALFDLVLGTRCTLTAPADHELPGNVRVSRARPDLPDLHRAANVVVTGGGYNSLLEAMGGGAEIIVWPVNRGAKDEQIRHARVLQRHYPLALVTEPVEIAARLREAIANAGRGRRSQSPLAADGIRNARNLVFRDLGIDTGAHPA